MDTIVGVFRTRVAAAQALNGLLGNGVPQQSIIFLTGDQSQAPKGGGGGGIARQIGNPESAKHRLFLIFF